MGNTLLGIEATALTSVELSSISGRRHGHILRSIERMNKDLIGMSKTPAGLSEYRDSTGRKLPMYNLTRYQCELLALALSGEARIKILDKLYEIDRNPAVAITPDNILVALDSLRAIVHQTIIDRDRMHALVLQYNELVPALTDEVEAHRQLTSSVGWLNFVKAWSLFGMSDIALFKWCRDNKYLNSENIPYVAHMNRGLFKTITTTYYVKGQSRLHVQTLISMKWVDRIRQFIAQDSKALVLA